MDIIEQFLKVVETITLRKAAFLMFLLVVLIVGVFGYEKATAHFRLTKLQKAASVLLELKNLGNPGELPDDLQLAYNQISRDLTDAVVDVDQDIKDVPTPTNVRKELSWAAKFLSGGAIWFSMGILVFFTGIREKSALSAGLGIFVIGAFFGLINSLIPDVGASWINLIVFPATAFGLTAGIPMSLGAIKAFNRVRVETRIKIITNHLRMIAVSGQRYILETGEKNVSYDKLVNEKYFSPIEAVCGEVYDGLEISEEGGELSVVTRDGRHVSYPY